jgi:hypothetical protein
LHQAKQAPPDGLETVGVVLILVLVTVLTKYSVADLDLAQRIGKILANFIVAVPLLLILLSPLYVRRVRRGLRANLRQRQH